MISEPIAQALEEVYELAMDSESMDDARLAAIVATIQGANYGGVLKKLLNVCHNFILEEISHEKPND